MTVVHQDIIVVFQWRERLVFNDIFAKIGVIASHSTARKRTKGVGATVTSDTNPPRQCLCGE